MNFYTTYHIEFYHFIQYLRQKHPEVKDSYTYWEDALLDYLDVRKAEDGCTYMLSRPDGATPDHWINDYIEEVFIEYFPKEWMVYLEV